MGRAFDKVREDLSDTPSHINNNSLENWAVTEPQTVNVSPLIKMDYTNLGNDRPGVMKLVAEKLTEHFLEGFVK